MVYFIQEVIERKQAIRRRNFQSPKVTINRRSLRINKLIGLLLNEQKSFVGKEDLFFKTKKKHFGFGYLTFNRDINYLLKKHLLFEGSDLNGVEGFYFSKQKLKRSN